MSRIQVAHATWQYWNLLSSGICDGRCLCVRVTCHHRYTHISLHCAAQHTPLQGFSAGLFKLKSTRALEAACIRNQAVVTQSPSSDNTTTLLRSTCVRFKLGSTRIGWLVRVYVLIMLTATGNQTLRCNGEGWGKHPYFVSAGPTRFIDVFLSSEGKCSTS
jgi:hypothetical protein